MHFPPDSAMNKKLKETTEVGEIHSYFEFVLENACNERRAEDLNVKRKAFNRHTFNPEESETKLMLSAPRNRRVSAVSDLVK